MILQQINDLNTIFLLVRRKQKDRTINYCTNHANSAGKWVSVNLFSQVFLQSASWVQNDEVLIHKKLKGRRYMFTESSNGMNRIVSVFFAFIAILGTVTPPAHAQEEA